ncbi:MAG TPA: AraC family ligand binding domain-containing protein [Solirubrobacteraceae bacterium]
MQRSRGIRRPSYTLVTPANHYPSRLPAFGDAPVVKLVTPRFAASRIGEYLVTLAPGGATAHAVEPGFETFLYALDGEARTGDVALRAGGFAYLPAEASYEVRAGDAGARVLLVKRRYEAYPRLSPPGALSGHRDDEPFADTDVPGFRRRELLPTGDPAFDFNMSLLAFDAGVGLGKVEVHDEEHGLYMTSGGGTYLLENAEHEVQAGDFIYMAPYCPQGFEAGPDGAEYLLYKDVWRDGF